MHRSLVTPLFVFLALAVVLRWGSFFISVINHDESTYIVVADELLRGETYLRDVIDTKPIGIFWVYAGLVKLTAGSIPLLRLAAALVVGLGGYLLFLTAARATRSPTAGYVAGVGYILMCSVYTFYGMSPNTEIYFNLFTIGAVALTAAADRKRWFPAGLLLGVAFVIKPFAAAEALAIGLYLVWYYRHDWRRMVGRGLLLVGGFLLPVAGVVAYFAARGLLAALYFYSVEVAAAYAVDLPWGSRLKYLGDYCLRYAPLLLLGGVARVRGKSRSVPGAWLGYLLLQGVLVTGAVLLTGKPFGHYQIQLHPVVALFVGSCAGVAWPAGFRRRWVPWAVGVVALGIGGGHYVYYHHKTDEPRRYAATIGAQLDPGQTFFSLSGFQIAYHLLDRPVPVPYVHFSLLTDPLHQAAFRIDPRAEARRVIADPTVQLLVRKAGDPELESPLMEELLTGFVADAGSTGGLVFYRRR